MSARRFAMALAAMAVLPLLVVPAAHARQAAKVLVFDVSLQPAGSDVYALPEEVSYGQGRLVGTTTWGKRSATVDWMCSHVSSAGTGPAHDLVTITRSDGAVLALAVTGWVDQGKLRGTVDVIGGKGAYRGATGTGTVEGVEGEATISLTVSQGTKRALPRHGIGC